jgi:hypothetical protein
VAIGDAAQAAGFPLVPDTGEDGKVKWGARELNRTRDFVAILKGLIPSSKAASRTSSGISSGTAEPTGGMDGDIYFKILP